MAIQFNLLPWRAELRANRLKRNKGALIGAAIAGVLLGGAYYGYEQVRLEDYNNARVLIEKKNKALDKEIKEKIRLDKMKVELNNQIDAIESLQADRPSVSHMVEELSAANNQQLFLNSFDLMDGDVNITGTAENDAQIADVMKQLRRSEWYQEPTLGEIRSSREFGGEIKNFVITSKLLLPGTNKTKGLK